MLLDEPSAPLDAAGRDALGRLIEARRARGHAVVIATHDADDLAWCDTVVAVQGGQARVIDRSAIEAERSGVVLRWTGESEADLNTPSDVRLCQFADSKLETSKLAFAAGFGSLGDLADRLESAGVRTSLGRVTPGDLAALIWSEDCSLADDASESSPASLLSGAPPVSPARAAAGLLLRDGRRLIRRPAQIIATLFTPALIGALFIGGFADSIMPDATRGGYAGEVLPGLALLVTLFSGIFSAAALIDDRERGRLVSVVLSGTPRPVLPLSLIASGGRLLVVAGRGAAARRLALWCCR